jgi:hypothetical protein
MPDGEYNMTFRLYEGQTGGSAIWEKTIAVTVTKGIFKAGLGPLHLPFDTIYWLGISVEAEPELEPRVALVSSPYALNARAAEDSAIATNMIANQDVTRSKIQDGSVVTMLNGIAGDMAILEGDNISIIQEGQCLVISATGGGGGISGSGAAGQVAIWDDTSNLTGDDWLYWDTANRRLGIGTQAPNARLRVESAEKFTGVFASTYQSDTTEVLRANYLGGGNVNAVAVKGISLPSPGYGIGGHFTGGHIVLIRN